MDKNTFDENYEQEGKTGELKSEGADAIDYVYNEEIHAAAEPVMEKRNEDPNGESSYYGYNNPYYNGRILPQYVRNDINSGSNNVSTPDINVNNNIRRDKEDEIKMKTKATNDRKSSKKKKKGEAGKFARLVASALVFGLVAGVAFQGVNYGFGVFRGNDNGTVKESADNNVETQQLANTDTVNTSTLVYDVSDIAEKVMPSIVSITSTYTTTYQYWFQEYEQQSTGAGSGIIFRQDDENLIIVTNYHVVESADEINVGFVDDEVVKATLKGYDEDTDIAVLYVSFDDMKSSTVDAITLAQIGDSDSLQVGEPAIAIGNALGYGQSVTVGYISALDRTIADTEGEFIQTDAAINPGNSGGALINTSGEVIGINSVKYVDSSVEGMGYAIPITDVMPIIQDIIDGANKSNQGLGITGWDVTREYSQVYGFPEGIYVKEVDEDSAAEAGGIIAGDIIVEFDGKEVYTIEELQKLIKDKEAGDTADISVYRMNDHGRYEKVELTVTFN